MDATTISTCDGNQSKSFDRMKIARVLLELAEFHLNSSDSNQLISKEGIEKLRAKIEK
ncbi:hypothetical protein [Ekhidna sp.]|uniref:hypothetical protein n=1 Tax=Ekhidna sp. TaxID=2608089 RepID=UPI003B50663C